MSWTLSCVISAVIVKKKILKIPSIKKSQLQLFNILALKTPSYCQASHLE